MNTNVKQAIIELEKEKIRIEQALTSLRALNDNSIASAPIVAHGSISRTILEHIRKAGVPQSVGQIRAALAAQGLNSSSLESLLSKRAARKKDLIHKGRGLWGLKK